MVDAASPLARPCPHFYVRGMRRRSEHGGRIRLGGLALLACVLAAGCVRPEVLVEFSPESPVRRRASRGRYVVLIDGSAYGDPEWRGVAECLREKHDAALVVYPDGKPEAALDELRRLRPRYACFVTPPERSGRAFVVAVHRLTRRIDDDPYTDVLWGILTGYEAADALRIAERSEPMVIRSAASSMGPGAFKNLDHGFASSETDPRVFWRKDAGGETVKMKVDPDPTEALAKAFNTAPPDLFVTSGHATERDWQIGYNVRAGQFRCEGGQLYALGTDGKRRDITSPRPKIYTPLGNCLIGRISKRDCMTTAWLHTGGVYQMFGYTAVTFHGYMGWGTGGLFNGGRNTLSEAFYFNNQSLVHRLVTKYPEHAGIEFDSYDQRAPGRLVKQHKIGSRDLLGALWDRDCVAFYGNPAWEARRLPSPPAWTWRLEEAGGEYRFTLKALRDSKWGNRPVMVFLPRRLSDVSDVSWYSDGAAPLGQPVVTDDFMLLPRRGEYKTGEEYVVSFSAREAEVVMTSAGDPPVRLDIRRKEGVR